MSIENYEKLVNVHNPYESKYSMARLRQFSVEPTYSVLKLTYDTYKKKYMKVADNVHKKKGGVLNLNYVPIIVI
jgi:hypothetical protein